MPITETLSKSPVQISVRPSNGAESTGERVERLCLAEGAIRWGEEWEELLSRSSGVSPLVWPTAITEEMRNQGRCGKVKSQCLGVWNGDELGGLAILPCKSISLKSLLRPFPGGNLKGLRLAGNQVFTGESAEALPRLMDEVGLELQRQQASFLLIEDMETNSPLHREIQRMEREGYLWFWQTRPQPRYRIQLPATAEEYWKRFSSKSRYNLRRQERRMEGTELICIRSPKEVARFLEQASHISRNSWQQEQLGTRIRNDEQEQRFLSAVAAQGHLQSYLLVQRGEPAAFLLGMREEKTFYYEEIGYDRKFGDYSPGTVLLFKVISDLYERDPVEWFDFGFGDSSYKRLFANHQQESGKGWLLPPGLRSRQLKAMLEICQQFREWGREMLKQSGWMQRLRQRIRRGTACRESE